MITKYSFLVIILSLLLEISKVWAIIPIPCRIGGSLTVNDKIITREDETVYTFIVTRENTTGFVPAAEDVDGLNRYNNYIIDIPIYEPDDQAGGAQPGDIGIINVYKDGSKLLITSPPGGYFVVNESGSQIQIDIKAVTGPGDDNCKDEIAKWDVHEDGKIGLEEAIQALQIVAGIKTQP